MKLKSIEDSLKSKTKEYAVIIVGNPFEKIFLYIFSVINLTL